MRLIDADALDMFERLNSYYGDAWRDAQKEIDEAPTVDAVPVIRCKDCESHRNRSGICDVWHHHTSGEGFCHRGRRYGQQTESKEKSGRSEG